MNGGDIFLTNPVGGKYRMLMHRGGLLALMLLFFYAPGVLSKEITLSWTKNQEPVAGYNLYHRLVDTVYDYESPVRTIRSSECNEGGCTATVTVPDNVDVYFVVRAFLDSGVESRDSNEIVCSVTDMTQPTALSLSWTPNPDTVAGYRIYMRLPSGQYDYNHSAASLPASECTSEKCSASVSIDELQDCYFVVRAVSEADIESNNSNEVFFDAAQYRQALAGLSGEGQIGTASNTSGATSGTGTLLQGVAVPKIETATQSGAQEDELHPTIEVLTGQYAHREWLQILWDQYVIANGEARISMGDIDGDGKDEIVVGLGPDYDPAIPGGMFQVLDDDYSHLAWGQIKWGSYNIQNGESFPSCGDIDGDGTDEILVGLGEGGQGKVEVFRYRSGQVQHLDWIQVDWPEYNQYFGKTKPACGDLDQDGRDEIVIGLGSDQSDPTMPAGLFQIKDDDFSELAWGELEWSDYNRFNGETFPSCADLDGRGTSNIVVGLGNGGEGRLEVFSYLNGAATHKDWITIDWPEYNQATGATYPVCGDIDGDGLDEILVGLASHADDAAIPGGQFPILDNDYTNLAWAEISWSEYNTENGASYPATGDTDGDQTDEVMIGLGIRSAFAADMTPGSSSGNASDNNSGCFIAGMEMGGEN